MTTKQLLRCFCRSYGNVHYKQRACFELGAYNVGISTLSFVLSVEIALIEELDQDVVTSSQE